MKKKLVLLLVISFVLFMILSNLMDSNIIYTSAFNTINMYNRSIPDSLLKEYEGNNIIKKREAEAEIKKICLNSLEYNNWLKYLDYIDLKIFTGNILPNQNNELIIALNLSKDLAVVCIFFADGQGYSFTQKIENLLQVETVKFVKIPDKTYDFLVIYQISDERLGAYYYEKFLEIFMFKDTAFEKKLKEIILYEEIYKSIWIDEAAPKDEWIRNMIKNNVLFIEKPNLYIDVSGTKNRYRALGSNTIPKNSNFKLIDSSSHSYKYFWNRESEKFSRREDNITLNNTPVFVIGDSETDYKNLCGFSKNKYKLMTTSDKILYIDKNLIDN